MHLAVQVPGEARGPVPGHRGEAADGALETRHEEGRGEALARDVAGCDADAPGVQAEEVVVVAGHAPRGPARPVALEAPDLRVLAREETFLDFVRDLDVALETLLRGVALAFEGALQGRDDPHEERQEDRAHGEVPVGDVELEGRMRVRREQVLPRPEGGADGRAEEARARAHEPDQEEHGGDVERQERDLQGRDVVERGEDGDPDEADGDEHPPGLPPEERDEARGHGVTTSVRVPVTQAVAQRHPEDLDVEGE